MGGFSMDVYKNDPVSFTAFLADVVRDLIANRAPCQPVFNVGRRYAIACVKAALARAATENVKGVYVPYGV
jgi:hypothetical protein